MNNSGQMFLYILLVVISLATGYWFYNNFAWVEEEKEIGFQGIAKTNKLLAAEFFLRKMGIQTDQVNGLLAFRNLPSPEHTLLIATQRETLNKELSQELLSWVKSGGHLIVEARYLPDADMKESEFPKDPLLETFSVYSLSSHSDEDNKDIPVSILLKSHFQEHAQAKELEVNFPYQRTLFTIESEVSKPPATIPSATWIVQDELGKYVLQFSLGQGLLTILSSTSMFKNEQIAEFEHARFLHYLVQQSGHDSGVWLIRVDDMPALWQWLWDNAWYAMLSLSILFLLWLWRAPLRFGPQLNDVQTQRRSLLEHIQASGYYRWHENQSGFLLSRVQEALWEKILASHPVVRRENLSQAYALLAEITGIKETLIKDALTHVKSINEHEFTQTLRILEMIRQHL